VKYNKYTLRSKWIIVACLLVRDRCVSLLMQHLRQSQTFTSWVAYPNQSHNHNNLPWNISPSNYPSTHQLPPPKEEVGVDLANYTTGNVAKCNNFPLLQSSLVSSSRSMVLVPLRYCCEERYVLVENGSPWFCTVHKRTSAYMLRNNKMLDYYLFLGIKFVMHVASLVNSNTWQKKDCFSNTCEI
jgi:hypothetical protein